MPSFLVTTPKFFLSLIILFFSFHAFSMNLTELIEGLLNTDTSIKSAESAVKEAKKSGKNIILLYIHHLNSTPGYVPLKLGKK